MAYPFIFAILRDIFCEIFFVRDLFCEYFFLKKITKSWCPKTVLTDGKSVKYIFPEIISEKKVRILGNGKSTEKMFAGEDLEIEIEYQMDTIGKFGLEFNANEFVLTNTKTDCLSKLSCGIVEKVKTNLKELVSESSCCSVNSNCC